ncbi:hypothetical protein HZH66_012993 [Vespula vulgaris]|uniref:Connector enhancer of kinase suppressor of ras 3 n=1 Tax=Vespula vulgaris TaxID=7454 RepID=A0A834MUP0_VESVU|nr:uncharacterized protein LOC127070481 isoform X1 [Vespula vulgaris]KAF7383643.1 hypothetical protein HZH66_012993 [Vespula vulgaris]
MAYVNVAEWKTDQVCEWLKGLDTSVLPYVHSFMNHFVNGQQLLSLRPEDLEHLGVLKLGHQEIILEAVEYLRNFHYELDRENLQLLALRLSCQAHSLYNELSRQTDSKPVTTQTLSDVASVVMTVKPLVRWLDRPPFSGQLDYNDKKAELMKLALEMATCAQRDRFAEKPIEKIRTTCEQLAKLADYIIQDVADPMILQPVTLDLATLKKRPGDELGFYILPSFHGIHQIADIKFGSAAHQCGKMEEGDEIVQINYQTVVGWERKNVLELFRESPNEILLTLKRRPRHTKVYGQIYIKPYRLPSNKKTPYTTRWQHNLPSPRPELLTIPDFTMPLPRHTPKNSSPQPAGITDTASILDTMATDSSDSDSEVEPPVSVRLYSTKPRSLVQRRATITGASPTTKHGVDIEQFWKELKQEHSTTFQLRDKAASCAHSLDSVPSNLRPQTCLGIEQTKRKKRPDTQIDDKKEEFQEKSSETEIIHTDECKSLLQEMKEGNKSTTIHREVPTVIIRNVDSRSSQKIINATTRNNMSDTNVPLDECNNCISDRSNNNNTKVNSNEFNASNVKERGRLDKSYSTPAYDSIENNIGIDRKLLLLENSFEKTNSSSNVMNSKDIKFKMTNENKEQQNLGHISNENSEENLIVNVSQKVNNLENNIHFKNITDSVQINIHNTNCKDCLKENQSNIESIISDNDISDKDHIVDSIHKQIDNTTQNDYHKITENIIDYDTKEETNYTEQKSNSNNEDDVALKRFGKILQSNDYNSMEKLTERQYSSSYIKETSTDVQEELPINNCCSSNVEMQDITQRTTKIQISPKPRNNGIKHSSPIVVEPKIHSCRYIELPKVESTKKFEIRSHLIPPEPPPRKYIPKPEVPESGNVPKTSGNLGKPVISPRHHMRKDSKSSNILTERSSDVDYNESDDCLSIYSKRVEKSSNSNNKLNASIDNQRSIPIDCTDLNFEICEKQLREERLHCEKYEPFTEKFAISNNSLSDCYKSDNCSWNSDFSESSICTRQEQLLESRSNISKLSEKDKSFEKVVVNKAMMVARSIGLHGGLSKSSNNSPRSNRKRNTLLAKKRNISVKDLGVGDMEGWLTYRSRGAGGAWARAWFVLKRAALYRFKMQSSTKADCLIALTGFTVSQAAEVKSRKYAFKVYHTGTVFYFAADTEDCLTLWLDAVNKATLGADVHNRNSALFSETDESDNEYKNKLKFAHTPENKPNMEKSFGSLKKTVRKDQLYKDHEVSGASLDRKYLRFLGTRNQNVPVPTAQFRSYRRVLPTNMTNKKEDCMTYSPDLQMTIAGSTFYGLSASQSATDMSYNNQEMGDYRRTTDRCTNYRSKKPDELQGFITLEQFMLSQQEEDQRQNTVQRSISPRVTAMTNDHVYTHHRHVSDVCLPNEESCAADAYVGEGIVYNQYKNNGEISSSYRHSKTSDEYYKTRQQNTSLNVISNDKKTDCVHEKSCKCKNAAQHKRQLDLSTNHKRRTQENLSHQSFRQNDSLSRRHEFSQTPVPACHSTPDTRNESRHGNVNYDRSAHVPTRDIQFINHKENKKSNDYSIPQEIGTLIDDLRLVSKRLHKNEENSGSSGDLTYFVSSDTLQRAKKEATVTRKGSFNLANHCRDYFPSDKRWLDSLRCVDKKNINYDRNRLKNAAQYQPPPIPASPFEQEGMRATFEMHLDKKDQVQKTNRLKTLFSTKGHQKPCTLDLPKDGQKTLLGSPRLHRALFWDKNSNQQKSSIVSETQSPGDSGISQSLSSFSTNSHSQNLSYSCSSVGSMSDWSPDTPGPNSPRISRSNVGHAYQKDYSSDRKCLSPPKLPYIPPPTSPPPDYPGLEYPPVFEPGTYSLSDASLLRNRNKTIDNNIQ